MQFFLHRRMSNYDWKIHDKSENKESKGSILIKEGSLQLRRLWSEQGKGRQVL
jgi:hypothetical protein